MSKVPAGWTETKLKEVLIEVGKRNKRREVTRVLSVSNKHGLTDPENLFGRRIASDEISNYKIISKGQFAYNPSRLLVGSLAIKEDDGEAVLSPLYVIFDTKDDIDKKYLFNWLFSEKTKQKFIGAVQGGVRDSVSYDALSDLDIELPPIVEQKKIAEILTSVDRVIELTSLEIDKLKDLKKGMMQELLTKGIGHTKFKDSPVGKIPENWECFKLNDIFKMMTGATPLRSNELYFKEGKIPWIKTGEIENCFIYKTEEYITELAVKETNAKLYPVDSILIAMYGAGKTRGQVGLLKTPAASNQACCALVMKNYSYNKILYCFYYLMSQYDNLRAESEGGDRLNLSLEKIRNYDIPLPTSILEIEKLSMAIHSVFIRINSKLEKLNTLKIIKKGLMNDLLTGKVRVKV